MLAILAITAVIAAPAFNDSVARNRVQAQASDLGRAVNLARSEAVARSQVVAICGSTNGSACAGSNDWSGGWIVFVDDGSGGGGTANDGLLNGSEELLRTYDGSAASVVTVEDSLSNGLNSLSYGSRGYVRSGASVTMRICDKDKAPTTARSINIESSGRASVSFDLKDASGNANPDGIYEDVNGVNLVCS